MEIHPLDYSDVEIYCTQHNAIYSDRWVQEKYQKWMSCGYLNLFLVLVKHLGSLI
jgi:flavorubredoxin